MLYHFNLVNVFLLPGVPDGGAILQTWADICFVCYFLEFWDVSLNISFDEFESVVGLSSKSVNVFRPRNGWGDGYSKVFGKCG
jgi:hypothetical protein